MLGRQPEMSECSNINQSIRHHHHDRRHKVFCPPPATSPVLDNHHYYTQSQLTNCKNCQYSHEKIHTVDRNSVLCCMIPMLFLACSANCFTVYCLKLCLFHSFTVTDKLRPLLSLSGFAGCTIGYVLV